MDWSRHVPVMVKEVLEYLNCRPGMVIVDCTINGGGHAEQILSRIQPGGRLIGIDQDESAIDICRGRFARQPVDLIVDNFRNLEVILDDLGLAAVDGFLFDLGFSSNQLEDGERGFSFRFDGPLDMRMSKNMQTTAADLANQLSEGELIHLLREYGEERWARRIARAIARSRQKSKIKTTAQLAEIIAAAIPVRATKIDPATKTFMALRMAVNDELAALAIGLEAAIRRTSAHSRVVVLAYHSKEDGVTKRMFRRYQSKSQPPLLPSNGEPQVKILTRKPITPSREEVLSNPRSRSAKLRAVEKL